MNPPAPYAPSSGVPSVRRWIAVATLAALVTGCASLQEDGGREFDATWPEVTDMPKAQAGAIYAQGTETSLWQNVTARNVGDTLTVRLQESTEAEKTATSSSSKSTAPSSRARPCSAVP